MVIDFHVHAFNPKVAEKAVEKLQACSGITPFTRGTAEETIQRFDEWACCYQWQQNLLSREL